MTQILTGAKHVSISHYSDKLDINLIASSGGEALIKRDKSFLLPGFFDAADMLSVRNIKDLKEFDNHPITKTMPNLRSIHAQKFCVSKGKCYSLIIWNPLPTFFDNVQSLNTVEHLTKLALTILAQPNTVPEPAALEQHTAFADSASAPLPDVSKQLLTEPTTKFILDTLITRQRLLARNGVSYIALKQWRKPIKAYQISALTALKKHQERPIAEVIANEMADAVKRVYGKIFDAVVPIPGGSSGMTYSLSVQVAELVAAKLGVNFANVLVSGPVARGSSHPSKSALLQPYKFNGSVSGKVLIVDDVVSTGRHIELATQALEPFTSHRSAIAWLAD